MPTLSIKSRNTKSAAPKKGSAQSKTAYGRKATPPAANAKKPTRSVESKAERVAAAETLRKADETRPERVTKQERVLTLLSQSEGASIEEMMQATDWQQHSVRGFLAGTVKKKLGFSLTSLKANGVRDAGRPCARQAIKVFRHSPRNQRCLTFLRRAPASRWRELWIFRVCNFDV